ncbi:MAG: hypothetical protein HY673_01025 [Chloroflexi bacterium]|nr:hypothetical protein [Chloroflexota bacterium]
MDARGKRIDQDVGKLRSLRDRHSDLVESIAVTGNPVSRIRLLLHIPTAETTDYPVKPTATQTVLIELPARYPGKEAPPMLSITTPIWHPNVYESGLICLGQWHPTEWLDLLIVRVMRLFAFDPSIVNTESAANPKAADWYKRTKMRYPAAFPTMNIERLKTLMAPRPQIVWRDFK